MCVTTCEPRFCPSEQIVAYRVRNHWIHFRLKEGCASEAEPITAGGLSNARKAILFFLISSINPELLFENTTSSIQFDAGSNLFLDINTVVAFAAPRMRSLYCLHGW
jgi:hypothetical protein